MGQDGRLQYTPYANTGESNAVNILPDFSYAGYEGGGVPLPHVPTLLAISPQAAGDDTARIQAAINHVSAQPVNAQGFRGAVLLKAGRYRVTNPLTIKADGVVLRGEGQDVLGTIIEAPDPRDYNVIVLGLTSSSYSSVSGTLRRITTPYVPVGSRTLAIANASGYSVGDRIGITYTRNQFWIDDLQMGQWDWTPDYYTNTYERTLTGVSGTTLTVDVPLVDVIQDKYGGGDVFKLNATPRISRSGIENLRLESCYASDTDEEHPWRAVTVQNAENCWVRGVTAVHFAYCTVIVRAYSRNITVEDCAYLDPKSLIDGSRRYSFVLLAPAHNVLFQRCYSDRGRHDFVTNSRIPGPNVFVDGYAHRSYSDTGPHHRWAAGTLWDNIYTSNQLAVENRASAGTGHGWSGVQSVFWNCQADNGHKCYSPKGGMNFAIGSKASRRNGSWVPSEPYGWWEHQWLTVTPRSLYFQQLADRLGHAAVENVTYPQQRQGGLWDAMKQWAGRDYFQPSPLVSDVPEILLTEDGATLWVEPLPGATILGYRWYEVSGDQYIPAGSETSVLTVQKDHYGGLQRTFFCRVVTDRGPYWSSTAHLYKEGLLAHWTLDAADYVGGQYLDISGEGNHAFPTGTPSFTSGADGTTGGATMIAANSGWATAGNFDPSGATGQFTISAWIKPNAVNQTQAIVSKRESWDVNQMRWSLRVGSNNLLQFYVPSINAASTVPVAAGQWTHAVCVFDKGEVRFYVNGRPAGQSSSFDLSTLTTATVRIGHLDASASQVFVGALDDIRIYNVALTREQVIDIFYPVTGQSFCLYPSQYDFDGDCVVSLSDFALFAAEWLHSGQ